MVARLIVLLALCACTASAAGLRDIIARMSEGGGAGGGFWTPANASVQVWLDASVASSLIYSNSAVTNWVDQSGSGNNANTMVYAWPTTNTFQGHFGVGSATSCGIRGNLANTGSNLFAAFVYKMNYSGTYAGLLAVYKSGGNDYDSALNALAYSTAANSIRSYRGSGQRSTLTGLNALDYYNTNTVIGTISYDSTGTNFITINGRYATNAYGAAFGTDYYLLMNRQPADAQTVAPLMCEVVISTTAVDRATALKYEGYMAWKWGLTNNLAADHPYKSTRPMQ